MKRDKQDCESISLMSKVDLAPSSRAEVWDKIEQRIDDFERKSSSEKSRKDKPKRGLQMIKTTAAAAAMIAIVGGGIGYEMHSNPQQKLGTAGNNAVTNVILADSALPGHSGQSLQLVDVKGEYVNNTTPGPYEGSDWTGKFELRVVGPSGDIVSTYPLPPTLYGHFNGKFQFQFADYNGNGLSDFALGQHMDSNGYIYELFEVTASGIKPLKTTPAQIFTVDHSYSPLFQKVASNAFVVEDYNNSTTKYEVFTFVWKNGEFKIDHEQTSTKPINLSTYHQQSDQSSLDAHLNSYLKTYYPNQQVINVSTRRSLTAGQYTFSFVTYNVNQSSLFATVVSNTGKNQGVVNFAPSMPQPKGTTVRPFDNLEMGGNFANMQNYFIVAGRVNDRSITSIKVTFNLNIKNGSQTTVVDAPISNDGYYFLFSKDAHGALSVVGYNKAGAVVYKVG